MGADREAKLLDIGDKTLADIANMDHHILAEVAGQILREAWEIDTPLARFQASI
ncbi:hypothetical protein [Herbidospora mongoliensis]|uniref:hypothetical protein n=1 Tax=Herbidospora mongoliensis TaxID=688067 RepID=UPI000AFEA09A|nr:hypothetical protein [Herbidospora mongoliensis]